MVVSMALKWAALMAGKRAVDSAASKVAMMVADSVELMDD